MSFHGPPERPDTTTWSVDEILERAREGELIAPTIQYVPWSAEDVRKLLESIYRGYPIGTLLLWETHPTGGRRYVIVDGRQRIAALVHALLTEDAGEAPVRLSFDLKRRSFLHDSARSEREHPLLPLTAVADTVRFLRWVQESGLDAQEIETANQLARSLRDYRIPIYLVTTRTEREIRAIFERAGKPKAVPNKLVGPADRRWAVDVRALSESSQTEEERGVLTTFFLPKRTDTHADGLAVAGLGELLACIGGTRRERVRIRDSGAFFELTITPALSREDIDRWDGDPFYPYVKLKGDAKAPPDAIDYEEESKLLLEARKAKPKGKSGGKRKKTATDVIEAEAAAYQEAAHAPHPEIALLRTFNGKRSGFKGDIEMNRDLRAAPPREALWTRLHSLAVPAVEAPVAEPPRLGLKASQWFLPVSGKGVSRVKADGAGAGQFPPQLLDWFEVWLRYIGMYQAMTSHGVGDDLKLAVIAPLEVDAELLRTLREELRRANIFGGKIDVRAPLELAKAMVLHSEEYRGSTEKTEGKTIPRPGTMPLRFNRRSPREVVRGLYVTTYKKMGTASSVMNLAFLGVPSWAKILDRQDAEDFLETLEELDRYQKNLDDKVSEDIETLRTMRDFLSAGTTDTALAFFARVAFDVMKRLAAKRYAVLFSIDTPRRVLMGLSTDTPMVAKIIEDEGFKRVAKAVRAATIHAQLHPTDRVLQPKYGLAQAWRQKAAFKDRFVEELARFVQQFNADVVRQREVDARNNRKRKYPSLLTTEDLAAVIHLIEAPGSSSSLVAHMLLAFGFAQVPKKEQEPGTPGAQEDDR